MRVAFVGSAPFAACVPSEPAARLESHVVDHAPGADPRAVRARLDELRPDAVVVFAAEQLEPGVLDGVRAVTVGVVGASPAAPAGPAQAGRSAADAAETASDVDVDVGQFDRLLAAGAGMPPHAALPVWRSLALPVDDRLYARVRPPAVPPRIAFLGASTERRERWLIDAKHELDVLHVASGLHGDALRERLGRIDVALNVHAGPHASFEHTVPLHLAAGHLVVTEPLAPRHGLRPGVDVLEVATPEALLAALRALRAVPGAHEDIRRAGRRAAERFRASRVWPRLLDDVARDLRAFGTVRRGGRVPGAA